MPPALRSGPYTGVYNSADPYDDAPDKLVNASNIYFVDPRLPAGAYGRTGVVEGPINESGVGPRSCLYNFVVSDGTSIRFWAFGGKLYRITASALGFTTATDVTPVGVTIDNTDGSTSGGPTTRYYMTQLAGVLVFSDGINRPWVGTNLTSTPITGTYIDADGAGGTYAVQGAPTLYQGALVMVLKSIGTATLNAQAGVGFIWSEPNQPTVGYEQTNYADFFNYIQTGSDPIYAISGRNEGLYIFRETSIGIATGALNQLQSSPTSATIAEGVGTMAPAAIATWGTTQYFVDRLGRPYRLPLGGHPDPIWEQLRGEYTDHPSYQNYPAVIAKTAQAVAIPAYKAILFPIYSPAPTGAGSDNGPIMPAIGYLFDADSGIYLGTWSLGTGTITFDAVAILRDGNNNPILCSIGTATSGASLTHWLYRQTVPSANQWDDLDHNGASLSMLPSCTTGRLGYSDDVVWNADRAVSVTMSAAPVKLVVTTPYETSTVEGTVTPPTSDDSTYRTQFGLDVRSARGMQFTASPTTATAQWGFQSLAVNGVPVKAGPEDA